jgi:hypothetical protein
MARYARYVKKTARMESVATAFSLLEGRPVKLETGCN